MKITLLIASIFISFMTFSQSCVGKWTTIDDETGKKKSIVELGHRLCYSHRTKSQRHGDGFVHDGG